MIIIHKTSKNFVFGMKLYLKNPKISLAMADIYCIMKAQERKKEEKEKKMKNMIVLNTVAELHDLINNTGMDTFVNRVAFAGDLLEKVRENDNVISIDEELGFMDDGGWIEIDEMGYVVKDFAIC